MTRIVITGLDELRAKFERAPQQYNAIMREAMNDSLFVLDENKPSYPPKPPTSTYVRTGTLGRTLGSSQTPGVRSVKAGSKMMSAEWGTNLEYAPYVIGEREQAWMHIKNDWWTIRTIADNARAKVTAVFEKAMSALAEWLNRNA